MLKTNRMHLAIGRSVLLASIASLAIASQGCDTLLANLPALAFCGASATPQQVLQLAEGPAIFVDAIRAIAGEVTGQSQAIGGGLSQGFDTSRSALEAFGPYHYDGTGSYSRKAAADRAFRLRFFYGDGVAGKTAGTPLDADITRLDSYLKVPNYGSGFDITSAQGPLFPLLLGSGISTGKLALNDQALRLDVGSLLKTTLKGYDLSLNLGTARSTMGQLIQQIGQKQITLSLADTAMTNAAAGFGLTLTKFNLTAGLDGSTQLGGDYGFAVTSGLLKYFGNVTTTGGAPALSLRCGETAASEFATVSFVGGAANVKFNSQNMPITLPALAPLLK
jgi:hypothetical protein